MHLRIVHSVRFMIPVLVTVAVLPSLVVLLFSGFEAQNRALQEANQETLHLVQSLATIQERITASSRVMLTALALAPPVTRLDLPASSELFKEIIKLNPIYTNILMVNRQGDIIASAVSSPPVNLADRKHFKDALQTRKFSTGEYIVSRTTAEPAFPFSYPLLDAEGQVQAVLIAAVELKQYTQHFSEKPFPAGSYFGIADHAGRRLFRIPLPSPEFELGKPIAPMVWDLVQTGGKDGVLVQKGSDQIPRIIAYSKLDLGAGTPAYMYMFAGIPEKTLARNASDLMFRNAMLAGGSWLLALLLSWMLGRYLFFQNIKRLTDCAAQVGQGHFDTPTAVDHKAGELGQVAEAFDQMAAKLQQADAEKLRLQEQLTQSKKLEAVGRLAGGIAHDFNNILSVILGYAELILSETPPDTTLHNNLQRIRDAGNRSANIVRQLLAFSRQQAIEPTVLDLNIAVGRLIKMLQRLLGENITLAWTPAPGPLPVFVDPSQIDQVLINLCVNARDAIDGIGTLTIAAKAVTLEREHCNQTPDCLPGDYVVLSVHDTGCGMTPEVMDNIFEPFYTTKGLGKGTGLGLATVYGIVTQNHGFIQLHSAPNQGSCFAIYLPRLSGEAVETVEEQEAQLLQGHGECLLLVEDEPAILHLAQTMLERLGYQVVTAAAPSALLHRIATLSNPPQLLITDVIMPEMNGRELADRIKAIYPEMQCLFMSGYTSQVIVQHGVFDQGELFIEKPFTMKNFAVKVRTILDTKPHQPGQTP